MVSSETVPAAGRRARRLAPFLRSQMRNIAPFLTLIFLSGFAARGTFAARFGFVGPRGAAAAREQHRRRHRSEAHERRYGHARGEGAAAPDKEGAPVPHGRVGRGRSLALRALAEVHRLMEIVHCLIVIGLVCSRRLWALRFTVLAR